MVNVVVTGAAGRMGTQIVRLVAGAEDLKLSGAVERPGHSGQDAGALAGLPPLGVTVGDGPICDSMKACRLKLGSGRPRQSLARISSGTCSPGRRTTTVSTLWAGPSSLTPSRESTSTASACNPDASATRRAAARCSCI